MPTTPRGPSRMAVLPGPAVRATAAPSFTGVAALPAHRAGAARGRVHGPQIVPAEDLRDGAAIGAASEMDV